MGERDGEASSNVTAVFSCSQPACPPCPFFSRSAFLRFPSFAVVTVVAARLRFVLDTGRLQRRICVWRVVECFRTVLGVTWSARVWRGFCESFVRVYLRSGGNLNGAGVASVSVKSGALTYGIVEVMHESASELVRRQSMERLL